MKQTPQTKIRCALELTREDLLLDTSRFGTEAGGA
jgi:hypothetical protein